MVYYQQLDLPIVVITERNLDLALREKWCAQGIVDYITLPISSSEFVNRILAYLHFYTNPHRLFQFDPNNPSRPSQVGYDLVELTCHYLNNNLTEHVPLNELSRRLGTNRNTLCRRFKSRLGIGVYAWVRRKRLLLARTLLINSELNIQQICYEVGYANPANFSTAFKAEFGLSPREMRKAVMNSKELVMNENESLEIS